VNGLQRVINTRVVREKVEYLFRMELRAVEGIVIGFNRGGEGFASRWLVTDRCEFVELGQSLVCGKRVWVHTVGVTVESHRCDCVSLSVRAERTEHPCAFWVNDKIQGERDGMGTVALKDVCASV